MNFLSAVILNAHFSVSICNCMKNVGIINFSRGELGANGHRMQVIGRIIVKQVAGGNDVVILVISIGEVQSATNLNTVVGKEKRVKSNWVEATFHIEPNRLNIHAVILLKLLFFYCNT